MQMQIPELINVASNTTYNNGVAIIIDGSQGEGGGQILRNSIALAGILNKEIAISNIRAGRKVAGLAAQHLTGLNLAVAICGGSLTGNMIRSCEIRYLPNQSSNEFGNERTYTYVGDTGTAGSICLLLQTALPCALFAASASTHLILKGGTNAAMAPQYDYWELVFWPVLSQQCGLDRSNQVQARVVQRGYYPKGGGEVHVRVHPVIGTPIKPLHLIDRGSIQKITIRSFHAGELPRVLAVEMAESATNELRRQLKVIPNLEINIVTEHHATGSGLGIILLAETRTGCRLAGSALGTAKIKAKDAGISAARELCATLQDGGCVDEWLQDQLILYMALAQGRSEIITGSLTRHTSTAIWIAESLSGAKFQVTKLNDGKSNADPSTKTNEYGVDGRVTGRHLITCHGIGFINKGDGW